MLNYLYTYYDLVDKKNGGLRLCNIHKCYLAHGLSVLSQFEDKVYNNYRTSQVKVSLYRYYKYFMNQKKIIYIYIYVLS